MIETAQSNASELNDELEIATWNRERTSEELRAFIISKHDALEHIDLGIE